MRDGRNEKEEESVEGSRRRRGLEMTRKRKGEDERRALKVQEKTVQKK